MGCLVYIVARFLLTSESLSPSDIAELLADSAIGHHLEYVKFQNFIC